MKDQILLYREMCDTEKVQTLQRGMNFRLNPNYSVILMSQRKNAPYIDRIHDDGITIEYEGHDIPRTERYIDPKKFDQPLKTKNGTLTENGKFIKSIEQYKKGRAKPEIVRVYEKILSGVWSEKGFFILKDYKIVKNNERNVYKFILEETEVDYKDNQVEENKLKPRRRVIPTDIKKIVWERDGGKCILCGATDELHFDHDLPYSKGGTSIDPKNVKILCARHNLSKSNKIE